MPLSPPLFVGSSLSVFELDGLIGVRPKPGHAFTSPVGTRVLYLPFATMVSLDLHPIDAATSALEFHGDFRSVGAFNPTRLEPIAAADGASYGTDEMVTISRDGLQEVGRVNVLDTAGIDGFDGIALIAGSENFLIMSTAPTTRAAIVNPAGGVVVASSDLGQALHAPEDGDKNACACLIPG